MGLDVHPLPRAAENSVEALRSAITSHDQPVLFHGLTDEWRSSRTWSPEGLARSHGSNEVTALMNLPSSGVLFPQEQQKYEKTMALSDFVTSMLMATVQAPCYLAYKRAQEIFPTEDHDFPGLLGHLDVQPDTRVWMGSVGTRSMLHSDLKDNLFCQVWGEKSIVLLPWRDSTCAYPFPDNVVNSQLDLARIDLRRHPKLRDTVLFAGTVGPGDMLYMPQGWWHDIRSVSPSVSLNHWFGSPLTVRDYASLVLRLGPRCWAATGRDFIRSGLMRRRESQSFFFSPPSTGKRFFDAVRWGNFSRDNDPAT